MDYLDEDEMEQRPASSRPNPVTIVALLAGAGAVGLLLWMNMGLSTHVSSLEESVANLQTTVSKQNHSTKELTDLKNQMDSVTKALANQMRHQAAGRMSLPATTASTSPATAGVANNALVSRALPPVTAPAQSTAPRLPIRPIPGSSSEPIHSSKPIHKADNGALPPPISSADVAPPPAKHGHGWVLNITSVSDAQSAYEEVQRLRKKGINAESARAVLHGRVWYRIRIPGFATHDAAAAARPALEARLGIHDTWVGPRD